MNIGFVGLGKLGLPCALAVESKGHKVWGYDINEKVKEIISTKKLPYKELWAQEHLEKSELTFGGLEQVVSNADIIFVPIQTPHDPRYEGITRIPDDRLDFDYTYLKKGIETLSLEIERQQKEKVVIIISTVLPGTIEREIHPLLNKYVQLCYNPFFIAMGTTMKDFLNPEFVLFGVDNEEAATKAEKLYKTFHDKPFFKTTIKTAELTKVAYNTFIGMKIVFANTMMEICHKTGADVDALIEALSLANDRIISPRYLKGGMGDGGGCHPRDNIALSWLSRKLELRHDFFNDLMVAREDQTDWLADLIEKHAKDCTDISEQNPTGHPPHIYILGKSFKPGTNITTGSPALLLENLLKERGRSDVVIYDPHVDSKAPEFRKGLYFIATRHEDFLYFDFPEGSTVLDPWRYIPPKENLKVVSIGKGQG